MEFSINGHHYRTDIKFAIYTRLSKWYGDYKYPISSFIQNHIDDCCDYWQPITIEDIMLDDEIGLIYE